MKFSRHAVVVRACDLLRGEEPLIQRSIEVIAVSPRKTYRWGNTDSQPTDFLGKTLMVVVDRPIGSRHPTYDFVYLLNYGYIPNTVASDGDELDAYVLGVFEPVSRFEGTCVAVIHRMNDDDDKLVIVPKGKQYTNEQIQALTEFQERFFQSVVVRATAIQ